MDPPSVPTPPPAAPVRVGVVGLGTMGVAHATVLAMTPGCELVGLADPVAASGRTLRTMGHRARVFSSAARMIDKTRPDAVFVCTPPDTHLALARVALMGGCGVFVERPFAHTLADAEALARLAAESDRPVACGYTMTYQPIFAAARERLVGGALGAVKEARASLYVSQVFGARRGWRYDPARSGGGVLANVSCELLFLLIQCLGRPVEVRATWNRFFGAVEDEMHAMMTMASGVSIGFDSSWSVPGYPRAATVIEVEGENGRLLVSNDALECELREARGGHAAGTSRVRDGDLPQPARVDFEGEDLPLADAAFIQWMSGGPPPPATATVALEVQRVMHALYASARDDARPVRV